MQEALAQLPDRRKTYMLCGKEAQTTRI